MWDLPSRSFSFQPASEEPLFFFFNLTEKLLFVIYYNYESALELETVIDQFPLNNTIRPMGKYIKKKVL